MDVINVWLAHSWMAHDKSGMGGYWDVYYPRDTAFVPYSNHVRIPEIGK